MNEDAKQLADDLAVLRTLAATPTVPESRVAAQLEVVGSSARSMLLAKAGAGRGWFGRLVGVDPATLYLVLQLVLLVVELIKQLRQRRPS